jgi:hypothetical protein
MLPFRSHARDLTAAVGRGTTKGRVSGAGGRGSLNWGCLGWSGPAGVGTDHKALMCNFLNQNLGESSALNTYYVGIIGNHKRVMLSIRL